MNRKKRSTVAGRPSAVKDAGELQDFLWASKEKAKRVDR